MHGEIGNGATVAPLNGLNFFDALNAGCVGVHAVYNHLNALSVNASRSVLNEGAR